MKFIENRIPPPLVMLTFAAIMWGVSRVDQNAELSQLISSVLVSVLLLLGVGFAFFGVLSFKASKTTINPLQPETASALVTSGVYQITRNPMYVGFVIFLLAWAVYLGSAWSLVCIAGFMAFIQRFQIVPEERALLSLFGQEFEAYMSRVRRWL